MALSEAERGYLAGIIDGEGSITLSRRKQKYMTPYLQVSNTYLPLLTWLKETFGGSLGIQRDLRPTSKLCWHWQVAGQKALTAIREAYPHLRIKRQQADIVLALPRYQSNKRDALGRIMGVITPEQFAKNEEAVKKIHLLNKRGAA